MICKGCGANFHMQKGQCEYCGTYVDGMEKTVKWQNNLQEGVRDQEEINKTLPFLTAI